MYVLEKLISELSSVIETSYSPFYLGLQQTSQVTTNQILSCFFPPLNHKNPSQPSQPSRLCLGEWVLERRGGKGFLFRSSINEAKDLRNFFFKKKTKILLYLFFRSSPKLGILNLQTSWESTLPSPQTPKQSPKKHLRNSNRETENR